MSKATLVIPNKQYRQSYLTALKEYQAEGRYMDHNYKEISQHFDVFVASLLQKSDPDHLPPNRVPETVWWFVEGVHYIGRLSIRHYLGTLQLELLGGHIGYDIRPSERKKGYGKKILALGLQKAKQMGFQKVLVTCDATNKASKRVIESNEGQFERAVKAGKDQPQKLRYWFVL